MNKKTNTNVVSGGSKGDRPLFPYEREQLQLELIRNRLKEGKSVTTPPLDKVDLAAILLAEVEKSHRQDNMSVFYPKRKHLVRN